MKNMISKKNQILLANIFLQPPPAPTLWKTNYFICLPKEAFDKCELE